MINRWAILMFQMNRRHRLAVAYVGAGIALAGCSSSGSGGQPSTAPGVSTTRPGTTAVPIPRTPGTSAGEVPTTTLSFSDNRRTVTLHRGDHLHVALDSAFWTFQPAGAPQVLHTDATQFIPPTPTCPPPQGAAAGCGTQTADYTAVGDGTAAVVATRLNCGEAMRCVGADARFEVTVTVQR